LQDTLREHSHIQCESLAQFRSAVANIETFSYGIVFFIGARCICELAANHR